MTSDPLDLLLAALKTYSPTGEEEDLAALLCDSMKHLGYSDVRIDGSGNAVGRTGNTGPKVLLCGHMDTVPGRLPVRKTGGAVYGRGAADAKSPLCAMVLAGAVARDAGVRVTFAGVTEEEGDGRGVEELARSGETYDHAVFGEPSGASRITVGYRGRASLTVTVTTPGGHAGASWAHESAFDEFNSFMERVREYESARSIPGDHYRSVSVTPTMVKAGTFHNVVPNSCEAVLDLRVPVGMTVARAVKELSAASKPRKKEVKVKVVAGPATPAYEVEVGSGVVRAFQRAVLLKLKTKPVLVRKTGTGDMNTFAERTGTAECVTYGPGLSNTSHTDHEQVQVRDYLDSIEVLKEALRQLGTLGRANR